VVIQAWDFEVVGVVGLSSQAQQPR